MATQWSGRRPLKVALETALVAIRCFLSLFEPLSSFLSWEAGAEVQYRAPKVSRETGCWRPCSTPCLLPLASCYDHRTGRLAHSLATTVLGRSPPPCPPHRNLERRLLDPLC